MGERYPTVASYGWVSELGFFACVLSIFFFPCNSVRDFIFLVIFLLDFLIQLGGGVSVGPSMQSFFAARVLSIIIV